MQLAKKWPEMVVKWPTLKVVSFFTHKSIQLGSISGPSKRLALVHFQNYQIRSHLASDMLINLYNLSFLDLSEITLDFLSRHIKNIVPPKCFQLSSKARISRRNSNTGASYGYRFQGEILIIIMVIFFQKAKQNSYVSSMHVSP